MEAKRKETQELESVLLDIQSVIQLDYPQAKVSMFRPNMMYITLGKDVHIDHDSFLAVQDLAETHLYEVGLKDIETDMDWRNLSN